MSDDTSRRVRLVRDLSSAASQIVFGAIGGLFVIAAIISAVAGAHVATPWLIVGAVAMIAAVFALAYFRTAADRKRLEDIVKHATGAGLDGRVTKLENRTVRTERHGDGSVSLIIDDGDD